MITEPLLLERLAMDDAAFRAFMRETFAGVPPRPYSPEVLSRALGYPWERPAASFLLEGEDHVLLADLPLARREALLAAPWAALGGPRRHAVLAIGSNGSPRRLATKLAHLAERDVLVLAGELSDTDVGAAAHPTAYGSMPATLFPSPGTAVRAAVLWVTPAQLTQLTWTEISYRLEPATGFVADDGVRVDELLVFASRWGPFAPDREPVALAAVPARGRRAPAWTQEQLLDRAARTMLGDEARAADLVRALFEDLAGTTARGTERIARSNGV